jgi:hypothetical protein
MTLNLANLVLVLALEQNLINSLMIGTVLSVVLEN